jgi:hypothetical protein
LNSFEGPPRIVRLWGKGSVLEYGSPEFDSIVARENIPMLPGIRSVITVSIHQVGSSCGYQVPLYTFNAYRTALTSHFAKKAEKFEAGDENESMDRYWAYKNAWSMDGLPGMRRGLKAGKEFSVVPIEKMVGKMALSKKKNWGVLVDKVNGRLNVAYVVIALLTALVAVLAASHPAFEYFPAQRRFQDLILQQVTSSPVGGSPSSARLPY